MDPTGSESKNIPIDGMPLDELERLRQEFRLDELQDRLQKAIQAGFNIKNIGQFISEDFWLKCVLEDIQHGGQARSRALTMLGMYLGILSDRKAKGGKARIKFNEIVEE